MEVSGTTVRRPWPLGPRAEGFRLIAMGDLKVGEVFAQRYCIEACIRRRVVGLLRPEPEA